MENDNALPHSSKLKLVIDTDPGIDDALAIFLALGNSCSEVLALTTVFGNSPDVRQMSHNAQKLLNLAKRQSVPVYEGAASPLIVEFNIEDYVAVTRKAQSVRIHGCDGLGDIQPSLPGEFIAQIGNDVSAAEAIVQLVKQNPFEVTLVTLGPLTNLALAIMIYPNIVHELKQVVMMGGALWSPRGHELGSPDSNIGNVTASAEANFYKDPFAIRRVLQAGFPVNRLVMVPLDLTTQTSYHSSNIDETLGTAGPFGRSTVPFHDSCAVFYALSSHSFSYQDLNVDIETTGELTKGMCVVNGGRNKRPDNVRVCVKLDVEQLYETLKHSIKVLDNQ